MTVSYKSLPLAVDPSLEIPWAKDSVLGVELGVALDAGAIVDPGEKLLLSSA